MSYVNVGKCHNEVVCFLEFILGLCNTLHRESKISSWEEYWISYFRINYVCYMACTTS